MDISLGWDKFEWPDRLWILGCQLDRVASTTSMVEERWAVVRKMFGILRPKLRCEIVEQEARMRSFYVSVDRSCRGWFVGRP